MIKIVSDRFDRVIEKAYNHRATNDGWEDKEKAEEMLKLSDEITAFPLS